jgi:hypothetical protein
MDYDRLSNFLSTYTTPGFQRGLRRSPYATLSKCGFHPGEAAQLVASLAKGQSKGGLLVDYTFQSIDKTTTKKKNNDFDDWSFP